MGVLQQFVVGFAVLVGLYRVLYQLFRVFVGFYQVFVGLVGFVKFCSGFDRVL